jgi:hypothetical protein
LLIVSAWLIVPFWLESRKAKQEALMSNSSEDSSAGS